MSTTSLFRDLGLDSTDLITFVRAIDLCLKLYTKDKCWPLDQSNHIAFEGFNTSHSSSLFYRGVDARPLLLALSGRFQEEGEVAIRRASCTSPYCLNPAHYYWGTRGQVMLENQQPHKKSELSMDLIEKLRQGRQSGMRVLDLSRKHRIPYHTARRICAGETYKTLSKTKKEQSMEFIWSMTHEICKQLTARYPEESREYNLAIHVSDILECPWHHRNKPGHKGNFGLMGECLDCMEEIKNGRCTVDMTNFDFNWYWQVKRFWEQVDIRGEDECWPWLGASRKNGTESTAYFPSPFHSGKVQSASRVAFWLSRGYTGKYRVFARPDCEKFCCNPKHLHIREIKDLPEPTTIGEIKLNYGNIFQTQREAISKNQSGSTNKLPPS